MRGETKAARNALRGRIISIHSPHAGRDETSIGLLMSSLTKKFQSTRPMRGETVGLLIFAEEDRISIHSPHAGRDINARTVSGRSALFQSTRPMRGETSRSSPLRRPPRFQSTRPMRGETAKMHNYTVVIEQFCTNKQKAEMNRALFHIVPHEIHVRTVRIRVRSPWGDDVCFTFAPTVSGYPRANKLALRQRVPPSTGICCRGNRISGYPCWDL